MTWTNGDDIPAYGHGDRQGVSGPSRSTPTTISPSPSRAPGDYDYFCSLHPHMTGRSLSRRPDHGLPPARRVPTVTALARARFSQLVLPRLDEGYRLARWLTGNPTDAEDVVQEASLRAFRAIEGFAEGNARAWFLTIVRNTCYSWLKRHRPRGRRLERRSRARPIGRRWRPAGIGGSRRGNARERPDRARTMPSACRGRSTPCRSL